MKITQFSTLTFDCYGTLIDWETGIVNSLSSLISKSRLPPRNELLQLYSNAESRLQTANPNMKYSELVANTLLEIAKQFEEPLPDNAREISLNAAGSWPAFPDSATALEFLKNHFKLVILSNVDNRSFAKSNEKLKVEFDAVYTAEDIGSYKPSLKNFHYMLKQLEHKGIVANEILHTAQSLHHDMVPATKVGLARCWIDRRSKQSGSGATPEVSEKVTYQFRFESMAEMAEAVKQEIMD